MEKPRMTCSKLEMPLPSHPFLLYWRTSGTLGFRLESATKRIVKALRPNPFEC